MSKDEPFPAPVRMKLEREWRFCDAERASPPLPRHNAKECNEDVCSRRLKVGRVDGVLDWWRELLVARAQVSASSDGFQRLEEVAITWMIAAMTVTGQKI